MGEQSGARERILARIREALHRQDPMPFAGEDLSGPVFAPSSENLDVLFAERFTAAGGEFHFAESEAEWLSELAGLAEAKNWQNLVCRDEDLLEAMRAAGMTMACDGTALDRADAGLSRCEALIARTGSILLSSRLAAGRALPIYPPAQIVLAEVWQVVPDIADGLRLMRERYGEQLPSLINLATGPSRTADIEKTLVLGAHGPGEVHVFLLDQT
jgi:L-lactate dehydrogenase complex protein LldG